MRIKDQKRRQCGRRAHRKFYAEHMPRRWEGWQEVTWHVQHICQKDIDCDVYPSFVSPLFPSFYAHLFSVSVCMSPSPVSPCPPLSVSFPLVLRTCRWHGAWPDKVIPQCRGLPGRDSLDTVSPLLARCRLQREGRPEPEWGGKKKKKGRGRKKENWNKSFLETRGWNQC